MTKPGLDKTQAQGKSPTHLCSLCFSAHPPCPNTHQTSSCLARCCVVHSAHLLLLLLLRRRLPLLRCCEPALPLLQGVFSTLKRYAVCV
jgi:hypothetical protein